LSHAHETQPYLSIVIPAYNEEKRLPASLQAVVEFVLAQDYSIEVIVVDNNSKDRTGAIIEQFAAQYPFIRPMFEGTQGKGAAVRSGMLAAQGYYRFFADADFSMPVEEINKFLPPQLDHFDIAIGSREAPGAVRYDEPWLRHLMGRVFNAIVRWFAVPGLEDTQCGFKMFRAEVAEDLFPLQTMNGWSFDVEILYAACQRGYRIIEVPINWHFKPTELIHPLRDSINMFREVFKIRRMGRSGHYKRVKS